MSDIYICVCVCVCAHVRVCVCDILGVGCGSEICQGEGYDLGKCPGAGSGGQKERCHLPDCNQ